MKAWVHCVTHCARTPLCENWICRQANFVLCCFSRICLPCSSVQGAAISTQGALAVADMLRHNKGLLEFIFELDKVTDEDVRQSKLAQSMASSCLTSQAIV